MQQLRSIADEIPRNLAKICDDARAQPSNDTCTLRSLLGLRCPDISALDIDVFHSFPHPSQLGLDRGLKRVPTVLVRKNKVEVVFMYRLMRFAHGNKNLEVDYFHSRCDFLLSRAFKSPEQ